MVPFLLEIMAAVASFRLTLDKPSLLRYAAVQSVIELCRAARVCRLPHLVTSVAPDGVPIGNSRSRKKPDSVDPFRPVDLSNKFDQDFVSAFLEVLNNVVLHAYQRVEERIDVLGLFSDSEVRVDICHFGVGFDMRPIEEPDLDALPEGGMGLFIAKSLLDELRYEPGQYDANNPEAASATNIPPVPNRWILTKRLPPSHTQES